MLVSKRDIGQASFASNMLMFPKFPGPNASFGRLCFGDLNMGVGHTQENLHIWLMFKEAWVYSAKYRSQREQWVGRHNREREALMF